MVSTSVRNVSHIFGTTAWKCSDSIRIRAVLTLSFDTYLGDWIAKNHLKLSHGNRASLVSNSSPGGQLGTSLVAKCVECLVVCGLNASLRYTQTEKRALIASLLGVGIGRLDHPMISALLLLPVAPSGDKFFFFPSQCGN